MKKEIYFLVFILVLLASFGAYKMFTKESSYLLFVKTYPLDAAISIIEPQKAYQSGIKLHPGRYLIDVQAPGYESRREWIEITDQNIEKTIILEEVRYSLHIRPTPSAAEVKIVEPAMAYTPGVNVKPGRYLIDVQAPGYESRQEWLEITDQNIEKTIILEEVRYSLRIRPTPSAAEVKIVEPAMDYTPGVNVRPGRYLIQARMEGYESIEQWINVTHQDVVHSVALKQTIIQSHPRYAKLGHGGIDLSDNATQEQGWLMTRDKKTGLIWEVKTAANKDGRYNWGDAQNVFIRQLNNQRFGGFDDWRLPSKDELESLIIKGEQPAIAKEWFPNTALSSWFWSSSTSAGYANNAWLVNFGNGSISGSYKASSSYVRAVREDQ